MRFIHTADWQLGMKRHFLSGEAQARYSQARLDSIRAIAELASAECCDFVVVCGDVFESNLLAREVTVRSLDAMSSFEVPLYLLPGNHDPINAGSVYRSRVFVNHCPPGVVVLEDSRPIRVPGTNAEVVGAPWSSKQPLVDLVADAISGLEPGSGTARILVGHGGTDTLAPDPTNPALVRIAPAQQAIDAGVVDYIALGDRHSVTDAGGGGRIWYSGTPLVTDYDEIAPNQVLLVEIDQGSVSVSQRVIGRWEFLRHRFSVDNLDDVEAVDAWLGGIENKRETVVKLSFVGTLSLAGKGRLDEILAHHADLFAALETWERHTELAVLPDEEDLDDLGLSGFAAKALDELRGLAASGTQGAPAAQDAVALLYRLARRGS